VVLITNFRTFLRCRLNASTINQAQPAEVDRVVVLPLTQLRPRRISYIILLSLSNGPIHVLTFVLEDLSESVSYVTTYVAPSNSRCCFSSSTSSLLVEWDKPVNVANMTHRSRMKSIVLYPLAASIWITPWPTWEIDWCKCYYQCTNEIPYIQRCSHHFAQSNLLRQVG
jgi:hypothetical protein